MHSNCTTGEVRLTGGSNQYEGRVQYCVNGVWQSFCDYSWNNYDAYTVCRHLGYQGSNKYINFSHNTKLAFWSMGTHYLLIITIHVPFKCLVILFYRRQKCH